MPLPAPLASATPPHAPRRWRRLAVAAGALLVLGAVFASYLSPDFVVALATRAWSCF